MDPEKDAVDNQNAADDDKGEDLNGITIDPGEEKPEKDGDDDKSSVESADGGDVDPEKKSDPDPDKTVDLDEKTKTEKMNHAFKEKQRKLAEKTAENTRLQQERDDANAKIAELTKVSRPEIPPVPDVYDPDYDQKLIDRDAKIVAQGNFDANLKYQEDVAIKNQQDFIDNRIIEIDKSKKSFREGATTLGIDHKDLDVAEAYVATVLTTANAQTAEFVLNRSEDGPAIVMYLSENPAELEKVAGMTPMQAAVYITNDVAPKVAGSNNKPDDPPEPVETFNGKKSVEREDSHLKGCTFE